MSLNQQTIHEMKTMKHQRRQFHENDVLMIMGDFTAQGGISKELVTLLVHQRARRRQMITETEYLTSIANSLIKRTNCKFSIDEKTILHE